MRLLKFLSLFLFVGYFENSHGSNADKLFQLPSDVPMQSVLTREQIVAALESYNIPMGSWPANFSSDAQRLTVFQAWSKTYLDVQAKLKATPLDEENLFFAAELLRMAANMEVTNAGPVASDTVEKCLSQYAKSQLCHTSSMRLYLGQNPDYLKRAERSIKFLRKLYAPKFNEEVEQSYALFYASSGQEKQARSQIESFRLRFPDSKYRKTLEQIGLSL